MTAVNNQDGRTAPNLVRRAVREPLVGFAAAAAAIFGFHAIVAEPEQETILLSPDSVGLMIENREAVLGRSLTEQEQDQVVQNLADQEVLVREAVKLGLFLHDPKTRKRLIDQMHFLMASKAPEPSGQDLDRLRSEEPDRYFFPRTVSFEHVFFTGDPTPAQAMLRDLQEGADVPPEAGDRFWLGRHLEGYTDSQLLTLLGHGFVQGIRSLEPGIWSGPVKSARGWHVVRVTEFTDRAPLPEPELQRRLQEDWETDYRRRTYDAQVSEMRRHYRVGLADAPVRAVSRVAGFSHETKGAGH